MSVSSSVGPSSRISYVLPLCCNNALSLSISAHRPSPCFSIPCLNSSSSKMVHRLHCE